MTLTNILSLRGLPRRDLRPQVYSAPRNTGIPTRSLAAWEQGEMGPVYAVTIHHSAGPRAKTKEQAIRLNRAYDIAHAEKGWGGIGYHASIDDLGRVYLLRPPIYRGAHTAGWNTGNIGIMVHGNYEHDRLTAAQKRTLEWLFKGGFFALFHVREEKLRLVRGHHEWPDNPTVCPGRHLMVSLNYRRNKDFH